MEADNSKRIVIIKGIQSNIIEEAILVLKSVPGEAPDTGSVGRKRRKCAFDNEFMLKEAELIVDNYIKASSGNPQETRKKEKKSLMALFLKWARLPGVMPVIFILAAVVLLFCLVLGVI